MASQGEKVTVTIEGGGPWGFRLFGGEDIPLSIARLRRKSSAQQAGLQEGDCLLTINGYSCKDMSHATAMTLVDTAGQQLTLTVLRGTQDKNAVDAAFQTLGPSKVVPPHLLQGQSRSLTYNANNNHAASGEAMDVNHEGSGASGETQPHQINGINGDGNTQRSQQTFYDGDTTRQVTTETSQKQFGSTTVTKVRREVTTQSGGYPSPGATHNQLHTVGNSYAPSGAGSVPTFSVTRYESSGLAPQQKPGVWAPSAAAGGGISVTAPEGVHVHRNADQSVTMTVGLGSPRQQGMPSPGQQGMPSPGQQGMASPRHRVVSPSNYDQGRHVPQFNVSKVGGANRPGMWAPAGGGGNAPELKLFTVEAPKWSPTPKHKQLPPEVAPKPQFVPQREPPRPAYDERDAMPEGPPAHPAWSYLGTPSRDSPITRIPINPPQIEPLHFSEMIRGESFSDEDDYLDSPATVARKKKIYADSSFYDDPEAKYPTIEEQIKMARKVAQSLIHPANKTARGHKMFMKRVKKSSRWVAGVGGFPEQVEYYTEEYGEGEPDEEMYYAPDPWKTHGHTWQPAREPLPSYQPTPAPKPQQSSYNPTAAPAAPHVPLPKSHHLPKTEIKPESSFQLSKNPAYRPSIPKPFRLATDEGVTEAPQPMSFGGYEETDAAGARDSPVFKPTSEIIRQFNDDMDIPVAPPPPPPPVPTLSNWATPIPSKPYDLYGDDRENFKKKLNPDEFEKVRLHGKKTMHNMVSPQVCFSLADDLRNMKGKGGKLFAKRRARAEQWVVEDKSGALPGPNSDLRAKILGQSHHDLQSPQSPPVKSSPADVVDYNTRPVGGPNRLKALIDSSNKSGVSPWEAAIDGNVDRAFDHLRYNTLPLRGKSGGGSHSMMDLTAIPASGPSQSDYNRRMKPWRTSDNFDHVDVGRMGEVPAPSPGGPGFRPVSFKAPSSNFGSFTGAPVSSHVHNNITVAPAQVAVDGGTEGYSDL